ncbi:MAG: M6 family metalloprotease domain-containing protein [Bacteroidales bacterium]
MKKGSNLILVVMFTLQLFFITNTVKAVSAYPYQIEFTQPDGSKINILLKGDEKVRWAETTDRYSILFNQSGFYEYAILDNKNDMIPSGIRAKNQESRTSSENTFLMNIPKSLHYSSVQIQNMKIAWSIYQSESQNTFPTTGNRNLVCVLIGFTNLSFTKTQADFNNLFNQINYTTGGATGSVKEYYLENSYNQFNLTVTVAGPFVASHTMAYYGANTAGQGTDSAPQELASEAVNLANPTVNFANFDNDNDGSVDGVYIIYAGYGEEAGASSDAIWSHASSIYPSVTLDGKTIGKYSCSPELSGNTGSNITNIGVICHEFGHVLGAPDFYDTDYATNGEYDGTGDWDLMAGGNWNNGGKTPAHHNAYTKTMVYAWASPTLLSSGSQITLNNAAENSNSFYQYNTTTSNEYFLIENRQQLKFDAYIPGHGMIIYHVDGTYISEHGMNGTIDHNKINTSSHQGMYPLCANASGNPPTIYGTINGGGCSFPGTGNKTTFTDVTTPNSKSWLVANTNKPITSIIENLTNKTVSFAFMGGLSCTPPTTQATLFTSSSLADNSMTIGWTRGNGNSVLIIARATVAVNEIPLNGTNYTANSIFGNGTQIGTGNFVVYNGSGTSVNITGLISGTNYYYAVYEYNTTGYCYKSPALTGNASTTGSLPCNYCTASGNLDYLTGITLVNFNTINNATAKPAGYNNYTTISTNVNKNATYNLTTNLNTDGVYTVQAIAWIDWNKDCDFNDAGETYDLGSAVGVSNGSTSLSPLSITIPSTAITGSTVMRIAAKYDIDPTSCENSFDGEVEDYTINVLASSQSLSVTPSTQNVNATTGSTQFSVSSTVAWTAVSNQTWCTVTPSGTGSATLTANYTNNTSTSSRTAAITVNGSGVSPVIVYVVQNGTTSVLWTSTMSNTIDWTVTNAANATIITQWVRLADTSYASVNWKNYVGPYMYSATPNNGVYYFEGITNLITANYGISNSKLTNSVAINTIGHPSVKIKFYQLYKGFNADSTLLEISSDNVNWQTIDVNPTITANQYAYGWKEFNIGPWAGNKSQVWIRFRFFAPASTSSGPQYGGGYGWMIDDVSIEDNVTNALSIDRIWMYDGYTQIPLEQNGTIALQAEVTNTGASTQTNVRLKAKELNSSTVFSNTYSQSILTAVTDTLVLDSIMLPNVAGDYYLSPFVSSDNLSQVFYNDTFKITLNNNHQFSRDYNFYNSSRGYNGTPYVAANLYEVNQASTATSINFVVSLATKVNSVVKAVLYRGIGSNRTLISSSNNYTISSADIPTTTGLNPQSITLPFLSTVSLIPDSVYWAGIQVNGSSDTVKIAVDNTAPLQNYYTSALYLNSQWYVWSLDQVYPSMIRLNLAAASSLSVTPSSQSINSPSGSSANFNVTTTLATWDATTTASWLTVTKNIVNGTITATANSANTSSSPRTATIIVSGTGVTTVTVTVVQNGTISVLWASTMSNTTDWTVTNAANATLITQWVRLADTSYASVNWKNYVGPYMYSATPNNGVYYFDGITNLVNANYGISNSKLTNSVAINTLGHSSVKIKFYQLYKSFNADSTLIEISSDNINWYSIDVNPIAAANQYVYGWKEYNVGPWAGNKAQVWIRFRFYSPASTSSGAQYGGGYGWMIDDVSLEDNVANSLAVEKLWVYDGYTQIPLEQNKPLILQTQVNNNGASTQTNVKLNAKELNTSTIYSNSLPQTIFTAITDTLELDSLMLPNVAGDYYIAPFVSSDYLSQVFYNDTIKVTLNNNHLYSRDNNFYYSSRWNNGNPAVIANLYEVKQPTTAVSINFVVNVATTANSMVKTVLYRGSGQNRTLIAESNYYSITTANIPTTTGLNPPSITIPFITPVLLIPDSSYWAGVQMYGGTDVVKIAVDNTTVLQNYYTSALFDGVANQWYVWSLDQVYPSMIRLNLSGPSLSVAPASQTINSSSGSSASFNVTTNLPNWTATTTASWLNVTTNISAGLITATANNANTSPSVRTATITVSGIGVTSVILTVIQNGAGTVVWPQSFEEANFPPTGWTVQNPIGGTGWVSSIVGTSPVPGFGGGMVTSCPNGGNKMAFVSYESGSTTSTNQWLISPQISIASNDSLRFQLRKYGNYNDTLYIKISTTANQTSNFTYQLAMLGFAAADSGWVEYKYSLAAYSGQQIYIAFIEKINDINIDGASFFLDMIDKFNNSSSPVLSVSPSVQNVNSPAGNIQFAVTSSVVWNAVSNQTWCTVTPSGSGNGLITANYTANTTSTPRTATITVSGSGVNSVLVNVVQSGSVIPDPAGVISGLSTVCQGQNNVVYTVAAILNASTYIWTLPNGSSGSSSTNSISVSYSSSAVSGNLTVKGSNSTGDGIASSLSVIVNPLPLSASAISGLTSVCQGQSNVNYTVPLITNATSYVWTLPNGVNGSSNSNSIITNYTSAAVSGNITVKGQNTCGLGTLSSLFVVVNPIPQTPVITLNANTLSSNIVNGNQWYNLSNGLISNATAQTYMPQQIGNYFVIVTLNGCSSDSSNIIYFDFNSIDDFGRNNLISVYPNPVFERVYINLEQIKDFKNTKILIYDIQGKLIYQQNIEKIITGINVSNFAKGVYVLKINTEKNTLVGKFVKE